MSDSSGSAATSELEQDLLRAVAERAARYRRALPSVPVTPTATPESLRATLDCPTPESGSDARAVIDAMADTVEAGGLMGMNSGRFFGFVIGGGLEPKRSLLMVAVMLAGAAVSLMLHGGRKKKRQKKTVRARRGRR